MKTMFKKINIQSVTLKIFETIEKDWMLISAGNLIDFNTMTANWGTLGTLWHKPVAICFIRPQRYTYQYVESNLYFTLSFFDETYKKALSYCGTYSGRDKDKIEETGLKPFSTENKTISFEQSSMYFECKKLYFGDIKPGNFLYSGLTDEIYPTRDFHRFYIGEILNVFQKI